MKRVDDRMKIALGKPKGAATKLMEDGGLSAYIYILRNYFILAYGAYGL